VNSFKTSSGVIKWAVFLLTVVGASIVIADSHDDVVYQRYGRKIGPSKIAYDFDMKFTELKKPATPQDFEKDAAVFTFDGLGPSRVWRLPECPVYSEWSSLKDYSFGTWVDKGVLKTNYDNSGNVCQAEELQIDGKWKRYFGFVSKHGAAVVPAEEIYLWLPCSCGSTQHIEWIRLPGGTDWGMLGPDAEMQNEKITSRSLAIGDALPVELFVRNRRGIPQNVLWNVYRNSQSGGPAFHKGITLKMGWAPFDPKNPNQYYPGLEDYKPISPIRTNSFDDPAVGQSLETGETAKRGVFDIRDWFNVASPGYYSYHFEFNPAELGLPTDEGNGGGVYMSFTVGTKPKLPTVEELDRDIPPFGGRENETKIRALIKQDIDDRSKQSDHRQPIPEKLPALNYTPFMGDNMSGMESDVVQFSIPNAAFLDTLEQYDRNDACRVLEALMQKEKVLPMKLLLASAAMAKGSQMAALFVLECMTNTDYTVARDTQDALRLALNHSRTNPPAWLVEMACAALSDDRYMTGLQNARIDGATNVFSSDTIIIMSYSADENADLTLALGWSRCTNATPFLIKMAKKTNGRRGPVMALGEMGDPRAIPVLIEFVKQKGSSTTLKGGQVLSDDFLRPVEALGNLHAKEAVPVLLDYIQFPDVIDALEQIGDSRVVEPLQKLIAANGKVAGAPADAELEQERVAEAKIAVASLDTTDRTSKLCELLTDASFNEFQRRSVVWRLGEQPDSQAIPFLAKAIKTDPSGAVVNQAITVLAVFKHKTAVDALIDSFDADFKMKTDWKRAYKPEMFRDNIADSLRTLTGQQIGTDKDQWLKWWTAHRSDVSVLQ
jgi:HEAT repeat protein